MPCQMCFLFFKNHKTIFFFRVIKMLVSTQQILKNAQTGGYAIGAFNIYNLEGVLAVISAAEQENSPAMLQIHPQVLNFGRLPLTAMCLKAAVESKVPISVHLDHCTSAPTIKNILSAGVTSIMADGSHLDYPENIKFTTEMAAFVHSKNGFIEAELGRLSGTEDNLTISERDARMTSPLEAEKFVQKTHIDALAVCIGNIHGKYHTEPFLDFERLDEIKMRINIPLVLHGASGLSQDLILRLIESGICKFNVNTEIRSEYLKALRNKLSEEKNMELIPLMEASISAMKKAIISKLHIFGSTGKARPIV